MGARYEIGSRPAGRFTALVYADSGMGKTHLVGTTPVNTLVIECDISGAETLEKDVFIDNVRKRGVRVEVEDCLTDRDAYNALLRAKGEVEAAMRTGAPLPFDLVVVDGLCALEDTITQDLVSIGGSYVQNNRPEQLSQGGWGALGARHLRVRRAALSIPRVHVVFTALERARGDAETKVQVTEMALSGQQGRRYKADVSYVFHLELSKTPSGVKTFLAFERSPTLGVKARRDDLLGKGRLEADLGVVMRKLGYINTQGESVRVGDAGVAPATEREPGAEPLTLRME